MLGYLLCEDVLGHWFLRSTAQILHCRCLNVWLIELRLGLLNGLLRLVLLSCLAAELQVALLFAQRIVVVHIIPRPSTRPLLD